MEFEEYLISKKIDPEKFGSAEKDQFEEFKKLFNQVHPNSFTQQKLFLINNIRRKYPKTDEAAEKPASSKKMVKPKILPKPKLS